MTSVEESSVDTMALVEDYCGYEIANQRADQGEKLREVRANISWENNEMALSIVNEMLTCEPNNQNLLIYKAFLLYMLDQNSDASKLCDQLLKEISDKRTSAPEYKIPGGFISILKASILLEEKKVAEALPFIHQAISKEDHPFYIQLRDMVVVANRDPKLIVLELILFSLKERVRAVLDF